MNKRTFGRTGFEVSVIGFGAAPVAYLKSDQDKAADVIDALFDAGVNFIDTALMYPGSEDFIGDRLGSRRDEFVLVTKCGQKVDGVDAPAWSEKAITAGVDQSLRRLKTNQIDVMLLHSCDLKTLQAGEAIGALVKAREAGKIRFAGYSGDNEAGAFAAAHPEIAVIETSVNIVDQVNIDMVLPLCIKNNIGVIAKRPVANGCWKPRDQHQGIYANYAKPYLDRFDAMGLTIDDLGLKGDPMQVWPEIALRFTLQQAGVHTAIVGTTSLTNAKRNVEIAEMPELSSTVIASLRSAFKKADPDGKWTGQT